MVMPCNAGMQDYSEWGAEQTGADKRIESYPADVLMSICVLLTEQKAWSAQDGICNAAGTQMQQPEL